MSRLSGSMSNRSCRRMIGRYLSRCLNSSAPAGDAAQVVARRLHRLDDRYERCNIDLLADAQHLALEYRQGQRQADADRAAAALGAENLHVTAQILDVAADDVHADAAAGDIADLSRRWRTRRRRSGCRSARRSARVALPTSPRSRALARMRALLRPAPSSLTSMMMLPPSWKALSSSVPVSLLPAARRTSGSLHAVVERVAHEMHQRIADLLEHGLVELGVLAAQLQLDLLAELARQVVHQAREAVEREADRQHADLHDAFLQLARIARRAG